MGAGILEIVEVKESGKGLDTLVKGLLDNTAQLVNPQNLDSMIEASLEQLEMDDTFGPAITDQMVDSLLTAQELYHEGQAPWDALEEVLTLYHRAKGQVSLTQTWAARGEAFTAEELETEMWNNFQEACGMVCWGKGACLMNWLDQKITEFEAVKESYSQTLVMDFEVTMESEMCHHFLLLGTENWLKALRTLKAQALRGGCTQRILEQAELGQRQLMTVQVFEAEAAAAESRYFVNFN